MIRGTSRRRDSNLFDIDSSPTPDLEQEIVNHVLQANITAGLHVDPLSIINVYVGMKAKPLTVLVGPTETGKIATLQNLAKVLIGEDPLRFQMMTGHSWWANQSEDVVWFTATQANWNSGKVIDLIQEAGLPENAQRMYIACLTRISPAELTEFFSEVAYQLRHERVMRVASSHLTKPIRFPANMFLVGTMDVNMFEWLDEDLLSKTSLIHWSPARDTSAAPSPQQQLPADIEETFLRACVRDVQASYQWLYTILKSQHHSLSPIFETIRVLQKYKISISNSLVNSAMIYVANAWSALGSGLFSLETAKNLEIAMDLAITQTFLLPIHNSVTASPALQNDLHTIFKFRFPHANAFVGYSG